MQGRLPVNLACASFVSLPSPTFCSLLSHFTSCSAASQTPLIFCHFRGNPILASLSHTVQGFGSRVKMNQKVPETYSPLYVSRRAFQSYVCPIFEFVCHYAMHCHHQPDPFPCYHHLLSHSTSRTAFTRISALQQIGGAAAKMRNWARLLSLPAWHKRTLRLAILPPNEPHKKEETCRIAVESLVR